LKKKYRHDELGQARIENRKSDIDRRSIFHLFGDTRGRFPCSIQHLKSAHSPNKYGARRLYLLKIHFFKQSFCFSLNFLEKKNIKKWPRVRKLNYFLFICQIYVFNPCWESDELVGRFIFTLNGRALRSLKREAKLCVKMS
jgi:hypothetical protein